MRYELPRQRGPLVVQRAASSAGPSCRSARSDLRRASGASGARFGSALRERASGASSRARASRGSLGRDLHLARSRPPPTRSGPDVAPPPRVGLDRAPAASRRRPGRASRARAGGVRVVPRAAAERRRVPPRRRVHPPREAARVEARRCVVPPRPSRGGTRRPFFSTRTRAPPVRRPILTPTPPPPRVTSLAPSPPSQTTPRPRTSARTPPCTPPSRGVPRTWPARRPRRPPARAPTPTPPPPPGTSSNTPPRCPPLPPSFPRRRDRRGRSSTSPLRTAAARDGSPRLFRAARIRSIPFDRSPRARRRPRKRMVRSRATKTKIVSGLRARTFAAGAASRRPQPRPRPRPRARRRGAISTCSARTRAARGVFSRATLGARRFRATAILNRERVAALY